MESMINSYGYPWSVFSFLFPFSIWPFFFCFYSFFLLAFCFIFGCCWYIFVMDREYNGPPSNDVLLYIFFLSFSFFAFCAHAIPKRGKWMIRQSRWNGPLGWERRWVGWHKGAEVVSSSKRKHWHEPKRINVAASTAR